MILLDTDVLIYAFEPESHLHPWARETIAGAVAGEGAAINAVSLAEICVGETDPATVADRVRSWGVDVLDIPVAAAETSTRSYQRYLSQRSKSAKKAIPTMPLPDFFIGAHAEIMGWKLATADQDRFTTYFPRVALETPSSGEPI